MRFVVLPFLAACQVTDAGFICPDGAAFCATMDVLGDDRAPATGVDVSDVWLYQGTEIPLVNEGVSVTPDLPVVAGRDALFRVAVTPLDGFQAHPLTARLWLYEDGDLVGAVQTDFTPVLADPTNLTTTANLRVGGGALPAGDLGWRVEIVESSADAAGSGAAGVDTWPPEGVETLTPADAGGPMRIRLVPIHFTGDEAGVPDVSPEQLELIRKRMWSLYPVDDVVLSVDEPWETSVDMNSFDGWTTLLGEVTGLRTIRGVPGDEWIYGLLAPTGYGGGIAGLSNLGSPPPDGTDMFPRASIGLGYSGLGTPDTMGHEVGHATGRLHSPGCGAGGPDPAYPYEDGTLGRRGFDLVNGALIEDKLTYDHMTYCGPTWVSDYNYDWYFQKLQAIHNAYAAPVTARSASYRTLWVHPSGRVTVGERAQTPGVGAPTSVALVDASGVVTRVDGRFSPFDHLPGGVVTFAEPGADVVAFEINGIRVPRSR
jgi:hypothetical protein